MQPNYGQYTQRNVQTATPGQLVVMLYDGMMLAFVQGRFEWGPRALGQRSILSLPAPLAVKERLNRVISMLTDLRGAWAQVANTPRPDVAQNRPVVGVNLAG